MKNKYQRLTKLEKKEALKEYRESEEYRNDIAVRLGRVKILSIIGILYAVFSFGFDFYFDTINIWDYVLDGLLLIACILFFIKANDFLGEQVNNYLISKTKGSKKKEKTTKAKK